MGRYATGPDERQGEEEVSHSLVVEIPIRVESVANLREHWGKKAARAKAHRAAAIVVPKHELPCRVTLMRIAPRNLDDDNLASAFKNLRDGIADRLGVKDNDPRVDWKYEQAKGKPKEYTAFVKIEPMGIES